LALNGLKEKLLKPQLIDVFLEEYRQEAAKASAAFDARESSLRSQKRDLDGRIANLMKAVQAGATDFSLKLMNEELNTLGVQRRIVESELTRRPQELPEDVDGATMALRLADFIDHLGEAISSNQRDAARSRDIIRGFIAKITITPVAVSGKGDGRGAGPVRIAVEGSWAGLVGQHELNRKAQHASSAAAMLDFPTAPFRYMVETNRDPPNLGPARRRATTLFQAVLEDAEVPITFAALCELVRAHGITDRAIESVSRNALTVLRRAGRLRSVRLSSGAGWVWNARALTDREWLDRAKRLARSTSFTSKPDGDCPAVEGDLAKGVGAPNALDEAIGEYAAFLIEDHGMRRGAGVKADRPKRHARDAKLPPAGHTATGFQE